MLRETVGDDNDSAGSSRVEDVDALPRGATVGRYVVLELVGSGGMGVVYAAYDADLDRRVALKVLRAAVDDSDKGAQAKARLLREGQAIARLRHPNVITVHDVGTDGVRTFIAMEFIDGCTLSDWIESGPRSLDEILKVFAAAGEGLAAAHKQGLIHRDFKPDNVLIGHDGRVCVVDFGLARRDGHEASSEIDGDDSLHSDERGQTDTIDPNPSEGLSLSITRTGMLLGTPAYMAPEQHLGLAPTAAADQFSFCVALYEALYGERPFAGKGPAELLVNVTEGEVRPPPADVRVPTWIRRVLLRGIHRQAKARFVDMEALLEALARPPGQRGRRWGLAALAMVTALGATAAIWASQRPQPPTCDTAAERWRGRWDDDAKARYAEAFAATDKPFAEEAWRAAQRHGDAYVEQWVAASNEACSATHLRHMQSPEVLAMREACLDRAFDRFGTLTDLFAEADLQVVTDATDAVAALPPPACDATAVLRAHARLPDDPELREALVVQRRILDRAATLSRANHLAEAQQLADSVVSEASELADARLHAEALLARAGIEEAQGRLPQARASTQAALLLAETSDDDRLAADAWLELLWLDGFRDPHYESAHAAAEHARALLQRWPEALAEHRLLISRVGDLLYAEGHYEQAMAKHREALRLSRDVQPPDESRHADALTGIGLCQLELGQPDEALTNLREAEKILRAAYGDGHPHIAAALTNLGTAYDVRGEYDEALALHGRALAVAEASFGPDHPSVADILNNYAAVLVARERLDEAEVAFTRAQKIWRDNYGPDHTDLAMLAYNLGVVAQLRGQTARAVELHRDAYFRRRKGLGNEHPDVADSLEALAELDVEVGQVERARQRLVDARKIRLVAFGAEDEDVARLGEAIESMSSPSD